MGPDPKNQERTTMGKIEEYLGKARDVAEQAGDKAKEFAGEVTSGAKDAVNEAFKGVKASKELRQGITELEALPPLEGSLLYNMEIEAIGNYLNALALIIEDGRLDAASIEEEIRKVVVKVQPEEQTEGDPTEEQQAIKKARAVAFDACLRALDALNV